MLEQLCWRKNQYRRTDDNLALPPEEALTSNHCRCFGLTADTGRASAACSAAGSAPLPAAVPGWAVAAEPALATAAGCPAGAAAGSAACAAAGTASGSASASESSPSFSEPDFKNRLHRLNTTGYQLQVSQQRLHVQTQIRRLTGIWLQRRLAETAHRVPQFVRIACEVARSTCENHWLPGQGAQE